TSRKGHPREFRNKVQESGTGESVSRTGSPMTVGLLVGRERQRRNRLHQGQSEKTRSNNDQAENRRQNEITSSIVEYNLFWRVCQSYQGYAQLRVKSGHKFR